MADDTIELEPGVGIYSVFQNPDFDPYTDAPRIGTPHFDYFAEETSAETSPEVSPPSGDASADNEEN